MDNNVIGIECVCNSNSDLDGYWSREHLERECEDLGYPKKDWLSYLFGHLFNDYDGWNSEIEEVFINNDSIMSMRLTLGRDDVELTKWYK